MKTELTHQDVRSEMERRKTRRLSMLKEFQEKGELTTKDLLKYGPGLSSRLHELREEGHKIVTTYESLGHYRYTYIGSTQDGD